VALPGLSFSTISLHHHLGRSLPCFALVGVQDRTNLDLWGLEMRAAAHVHVEHRDRVLTPAALFLDFSLGWPDDFDADFVVAEPPGYRRELWTSGMALNDARFAGIHARL